ncbi:unnamed protein product [Brassicogethes aeneus]|uniref:MTOR-associated protein MEAK7 n=1 Tax=Brassicogethes aeneus TaxID=1431903 RepID=A0A9P0AWV9_BRAAE|nr:unnamed protein product [Brassicogethes aeneus]
MGANSSKKLAAKCSFLSKDEQVIVGNSFRLASKNSEKIKEDELTKLWGAQMDPRLLQYINNYLFGLGESRINTVDLERFAELFVFCTRGTVDEKVKVLLISLGNNEQEDIDIPNNLVIEYVESIVASYMKIQKICNSKQYKSWATKGCVISPQNTQRFAESLTNELENKEIKRKALETWLQGSTVLGQLLLYVFMHLYNISHKDKALLGADKTALTSLQEAPECLENEKDRTLLPMCKNMELIPSYPSILDLNQIVFVNAHLPQLGTVLAEWRFLFSSEIHGESFSTLLGRIVNQGPSVLILEDKGGHVFGGFASSNWELGPKFYGDDSSFLFSLSPKMRVFPSTGYNQHFQYLNLHQQTLPNGLAMGGQHGYNGIWIDSEYGHGQCSQSCTTYQGYEQLSSAKDFQFRHLEVWGLGAPPLSAQEKGERVGSSGGGSVLDGNAENKAMLEMAGKKMHSDGLREPEPT